MKKAIKYLAAAAVAASFAFAPSCQDLRFGDDFLEKAPGVDVTIDTVFSSKMYADRALVAAYACLRCGYPVHNNACRSAPRDSSNTRRPAVR